VHTFISCVLIRNIRYTALFATQSALAKSGNHTLLVSYEMIQTVTKWSQMNVGT